MLLLSPPSAVKSSRPPRPVLLQGVFWSSCTPPNRWPLLMGLDFSPSRCHKMLHTCPVRADRTEREFVAAFPDIPLSSTSTPRVAVEKDLMFSGWVWARFPWLLPPPSSLVGSFVSILPSSLLFPLSSWLSLLLMVPACSSAKITSTSPPSPRLREGRPEVFSIVSSIFHVRRPQLLEVDVPEVERVVCLTT